MKIAIIPARGGSKRIPRKNIKLFHGKPMIAWSIEAARKANCFDRIIISTDDAEIAEVARNYGAEVPFVRPEKLSDDYATTVDVIRHAVNWLSYQGQTPKLVCCIYATAPFIQVEDLLQGLKLMKASECHYAFSATTFAFPIQRALKIDGHGKVSMFQPEHLLTRSQDLEEAYHDAGLFYWGKAEAWQRAEPLFGSASRLVMLDRHRVQDIDTPEDWERAERLFQLL
ncbi:pseudaminic acid cytidylyltransferase [Endozoicomonas sp. SCSIO W0465]|uniref:pseudaminic acid cytidylyltransferase n=1 Tax=Endozoicomonas sp. SCSIO W0465 TaxID=2918516 RepID=UPI0020755612|nr:pseudaminic acid cytidylyltransferase [Endozoicomonas sp. SCSIO W0465]USE39409.1 pseudaminic acid cytidylyltransferase [Endozoicomonas sp. SCSIO W0465]